LAAFFFAKVFFLAFILEKSYDPLFNDLYIF